MHSTKGSFAFIGTFSITEFHFVLADLEIRIEQSAKSRVPLRNYCTEPAQMYQLERIITEGKASEHT